VCTLLGDLKLDVPQQYIMKAGLRGVERVNFSKYFLDTLLKDDRYSESVVAAKTAGEQDYKSADASSKAGAVMAAITGFGWSKTAGGIIVLQNQSITNLLIHQAQDWARIVYAGPLGNGNVDKFTLKARTEGFVGNKKIVGVELKGNDSKTPGLSNLRSDSLLLENALTLLKSGLVVYKDFQDEWQFNEIKFVLVKNPFRFIGGDKEVFGVVELGLSTDLNKMRKKEGNYDNLCIMCLEIIDKIVYHTKSIWKNLQI
jgi:hypothetical protein